MLMRWPQLVFFITVPLLVLSQPPDDPTEAYLLAGSYNLAEKWLLSTLENNSDPALKSKLGEVYAFQSDWDKAIDIYRELTLEYPGNATYQFRYGGVMAKKAQNSNLFIGLAMLGKIKSSFRKAINLDPGHIGAHWALIDLYVSLPGIVGGSLNKARDYANQLKQLSPLDGYLALGYIYEYDDESEKARDYYLRAFELLGDPEMVERNQLNYQIGKICGELGIDMDRGITHLNNYISNYTVLDGVPLEWAYYRLAKIYRKKSLKNEAMVWIDKSLEIRPDLKQALAEKSAIERL